MQEHPAAVDLSDFTSITLAYHQDITEATARFESRMENLRDIIAHKLAAEEQRNNDNNLRVIA